MASISDVSLLEILTKAYGRANGYRKVMKVWAFYCFAFVVHNRIGLCLYASLALVDFSSIFHRDANVCILE